MVYRKRIYYTDTQKAEMWDRWQKGDIHQTQKTPPEWGS